MDHPPTGSKDVADAMAGVVFGLTMRRETWARHRISPFEIPDHIRAVSVSQRDMTQGDMAK